jgi:hypothetical protein
MAEQQLEFQRTLQFRIGDKIEKGVLWIGSLEQKSGRGWACYWSISHLHPSKGVMYGEDALEAFTRCLRFVASFLIGSMKDGYEFWWRYEGDIGGFDGYFDDLS